MSSQIIYKMNNQDTGARKIFIRRLFDSIVPTYDLLNHILSLGIDVIWRRDMVARMDRLGDSMVIDLCCGTGDVSGLLRKKGAKKVVSLDFSLEMIRSGKRKGVLNDPVAGDACLLPFKDNLFDAVTIAFGIRNIPDLERFMREVCRVLKPDGQLLILELIRPENIVVGFFYSFYLMAVLPIIGGLLSGSPIAYRYLSKTIATFIHPLDIQVMLARSGFGLVTNSQKTFSVATLMTCRKGHL
ncbi:MAG: ubiquinone/menaquinone biosynthesis methyltransferase [Deltaproteobacteria bacterium]|nr:ubiquinone/menaquinone biosynthesis methyltransferase [Deltaproteobacteria bacterium]